MLAYEKSSSPLVTRTMQIKLQHNTTHTEWIGKELLY